MLKKKEKRNSCFDTPVAMIAKPRMNNPSKVIIMQNLDDLAYQH